MYSTHKNEHVKEKNELQKKTKKLSTDYVNETYFTLIIAFKILY